VRTTTSRILLSLAALTASTVGAVALRRWHRAKTARWQEEVRALAAHATCEPQPGDILLFDQATGPSILITLFTDSPFYHVGLYDGADMSVECRVTGVLRESLEDRRNRYLAVPAPQAAGAAALAWAQSKLGERYDAVGVLVIILDHLFTRLNLRFHPQSFTTCGRFVADAYAHAGVELFPGRPHDELVPADFAELLRRPTSRGGAH